MTISKRAKTLVSEVCREGTKYGDIKKIAKDIKPDHELAMELWSTDEFLPRMLAVLIMDKKLLTQELLETIAADIKGHEYDQRNQITDWLLANQLMKDKKIISLMLTWEQNPSPVLRRLFWYYQARLRWTGQAPPDNTHGLLKSLEKGMAGEEPEVQWAMNFAAGQIGVYETEYRRRCVKLGEKLGLYKDEPVSRGCTPNYLPEFIRIEVEKLNKK